MTSSNNEFVDNASCANIVNKNVLLYLNVNKTKQYRVLNTSFVILFKAMEIVKMIILLTTIKKSFLNVNIICSDLKISRYQACVEEWQIY